MILVLTGAPGAGKGTQADLIAEHLGWRKVSTGDALRKHVKEGTEIGQKAGALMAEGKLVPDDVLFQILKAEVGGDKEDKILLDGYPRNVEQAKTLEGLNDTHPVVAAIHLDVDSQVLEARLTGRRVCSGCGKSYHIDFDPPRDQGRCSVCESELVQRPDDKLEKVKVRLEIYEEQTAPVLDFYRKKGLYHRVNGEGSQKVVFERIADVTNVAER